MERRILLWLLVGAYALAIFLLSSSSNPPSDGDLGLKIPFFDKIAHFFIYFLFGYILFRASKESDFEAPVFSAYILGTFYAFTDEIHQYFVPHRCTDPMDFLVDALAISIAIGAAMIERPIKWK